MTDPQLIRACLHRDRAAEKQLFLRHAAKVLSICRRYAATEAEAQDWMQECWLRMFDKLDQFDPARGAFGGWLHRLCTHHALGKLRQRQREVPTIYPEELPESAADYDSEVLDQVTTEQLIAAVQELPDGYRTVVNLHVLEGWTHREIADHLDIAPVSSRSQFSRAKKLLYQLLQKKTPRHETRSTGKTAARPARLHRAPR